MDDPISTGEKVATLGGGVKVLLQQLHASGEGMRTQAYSSQQVKALIEQAKEMLA